MTPCAWWSRWIRCTATRPARCRRKASPASSPSSTRGSRSNLGALTAPPKSIARQLFRLAVPIIGINVLHVSMLAVDLAMCGRLPNSEVALSALGYATQIVFLLVIVMAGLTVGTVALVSRAYGAGDTERVNHLLTQAAQLTAIVGVTIGCLGAVLAGPILRAIGASEPAVAVGVEYLRPLMLSTPFFYFSLLYAGVLRGVGNTRIPFQCALVASVINLVLVYGLVLGKLGMPALGVSGAAIGTVIAQMCNVTMLVVTLRRGVVANLVLRFRLQRIDPGLTKELFRVGWPAALDVVILNAAALGALAMLSRIDQITVAAHGLGLRVQTLAFVPGLGISMATGAMVGQALGAGDVARAREVTRASMRLCIVIMSTLALAIVAAAYPVLQVFDVTRGSQLEDYAVQAMRILALSMIPAALSISLNGLFQGSGSTWTSLRINVWTTLAIHIPLAYVLAFAFDLGALGVWLSFPFAFVAKSVFSYVAYRQENWAITGTRVRPK
ncbi:MAG: MATE family efflux transporter [Kofleriaceae bacterium]